MKTTDRQKKLIQVIKMQLNLWDESSNLDSPTHLCDINESVTLVNSDKVLNESESEKFSNLIQEIFFFIRFCK